MDLREIIQAVGAEIILGADIIGTNNVGAKESFANFIDGNFAYDVRLSTDTRTIQKGDLYLPLKGANFDGENFCEQAIAQGAIGCFVTKNTYPKNAQIVLKVDDTLKTYLKIANFYRQKINPKVVAITGSSGKTTTKELVFSVLSQKFKTVKTLSNHNNEIGLCQTIFSCTPETEVLIVEMGMRGMGEIELLSRYAQPDIAIITNAGSAHLGRLGSLDNIAKAKCEIALHLNKNGTLIAEDNPRIKKFNSFDGNCVYIANDNAQILERRSDYTKFLYEGQEFELNVSGDFNVTNSIFAILAGKKLGLTNNEIRQGLKSYKPIEKRWEMKEILGLNIINDSYNANPESMVASVRTFLNLYKNPVVVLGDMGELGKDEGLIHAQVGEKLSEITPKGTIFITVGELSEKIADKLKDFEKYHFADNKSAGEFIKNNVNKGSNVFFKASRAMKFEEIIEFLEKS